MINTIEKKRRMDYLFEDYKNLRDAIGCPESAQDRLDLAIAKHDFEIACYEYDLTKAEEELAKLRTKISLAEKDADEREARKQRAISIIEKINPPDVAKEGKDDERYEDLALLGLFWRWMDVVVIEKLANQQIERGASL
jgi:chromosome segregation ATPase